MGSGWRGAVVAALVVAGVTACSSSSSTVAGPTPPPSSMSPTAQSPSTPATAAPDGSETDSAGATATPAPSRSYPVVAPPDNPPRAGGVPVVYLTYDDGPAPTGTPRVLAALRRHDAVATFMVVGYLAKRYPAVLRAIVGQGSAVGNHTYTHAWLTRTSDHLVHWQLAATQQVVQAATGRSPSCLRPPYGAVDARVRYLASTQGLVVQMWNNDWTGGSMVTETDATVQQAATRVLAKLHPGSVVLMHDGEQWGPKSAAITDIVLTQVAARGWRTAVLCPMTG